MSGQQCGCGKNGKGEPSFSNPDHLRDWPWHHVLTPLLAPLPGIPHRTARPGLCPLGTTGTTRLQKADVGPGERLHAHHLSPGRDRLLSDIRDHKPILRQNPGTPYGPEHGGWCRRAAHVLGEPTQAPRRTKLHRPHLGRRPRPGPRGSRNPGDRKLDRRLSLSPARILSPHPGSLSDRIGSPSPTTLCANPSLDYPA